MQKLYGAAGGAPGGFPGGAPGGFPGASDDGPSVDNPLPSSHRSQPASNSCVIFWICVTRPRGVSLLPSPQVLAHEN
jgi:hypothetical protein